MQRASARHAHIARLDIEVAAAACGGDSMAVRRRSRRGDGTGRNQPDVRGPAGFNDDSAAARRADDAGRDIDVSSAAADRDCVAVCGGSRGGDRPRHIDVNAAGTIAVDAQAASASRDRAGRHKPDVRAPVGCDNDSAAARRADDAGRDIDVSSAAADRDCVAVCGGSRGGDRPRHIDVNAAGTIAVDAQAASASRDRAVHLDADLAASRHVFDKHSVRAGAGSSCDIARHANVDGAGAIIVDKDPAPALGSRVSHRNADIALGLLPHFDRMGVVVATLGDKVLCGNRDIRVSDTASQKDPFVPSALAGDASRRCD